MGARRAQIDMSLESFQAKISKAVGIAALGVALAGPVVNPMPAVADGAVSSSTVYRTRLNYGTKLLNLTPAVQSGKRFSFLIGCCISIIVLCIKISLSSWI